MDLNQTDWGLKCIEDNNSIIIDVRADHELAEGIIPNAINIDIYGGQLFMDEINKLDKNKSNENSKSVDESLQKVLT